MKKLLAIVLALALCLSFSVMAFAADETKTEEKNPSRSDSAGDSSMAEEPDYYAGGAPASTAVDDEDMAQAEAAMDAAEELGYTPVEVKVVDAEGGAAEVEVELTANQVVLLIGKDGKLIKMLTAEDVAAMGGKIIVNESCTIVIADK